LILGFCLEESDPNIELLKHLWDHEFFKTNPEQTWGEINFRYMLLASYRFKNKELIKTLLSPMHLKRILDAMTLDNAIRFIESTLIN
jgi:hypothetical protein